MPRADMLNQGRSRPAALDSLDDLARLSTELHASLYLDEILRACRFILSECFPIRSLALVQHRATESTAVLHSLPRPGDTSPARKVFVLRDSRLQACLVSQTGLVVHFSDPSEMDEIERQYLIDAEAGVAVYTLLVWNGKLKGSLVLGLPRTEAWSEERDLFLRRVSGHLALAIENSDLHYFERRRGRQLQMVSEIARQAVRMEDLGEFLRSAASLLREGFNYHAVQIWTQAPTREGLRLQGYAGLAAGRAGEFATLPPIVEECRKRNEIIHLTNTLVNPPIAPTHSGTASQLAVPVRLRNKFLGVLSVESIHLDGFGKEDLSVMEGVSSLIATTFDNLSDYQTIKQSNEHLSAILESAKDLAILSTDKNGYIITSSTGTKPIFHQSREEVLGRDILTLFTNSRFQKELAQYIATREKATLERRRLYEWNGGDRFLDVTLQRVFDTDDHVVGFLCIARDISDNVRLQASLETLSITDDLTGLYNQRRFLTSLTTEMDRARRFGRVFSLCFFDLDGFKKFNDTQGHLRGDQVLKHTSEIIFRQVRANVDTCYRYGGDEFTVIMPETRAAEAQVVAERIRQRLAESYESQITASVGIAECNSDSEIETLIEEADRAMYSAKAQGGNCIVVAGVSGSDE